MKKIITLFVLLTFFKGFTQCPTPSNLNVIDNIALSSTAELSWTENGTATQWELAVIPNFNIGDPLPSFGTNVAINPFILTNIPTGFGCYVFFVRSVCSATDVSPWVAVGSSGCDTNVYNYLATLSNNDFYVNDSKVKVYPNPSKGIYNIDLSNENEPTTITVFNILGEQVFKQSLTPEIQNQIDISNVANGYYIARINNESLDTIQKIIKN